MEFLEGDKIDLRILSDEDFRGPYLRGINSQQFDQFTDHALFPKNEAALREYSLIKAKNKDLWLGIFNKSNQKHVGNIELSQITAIHRKALYAILLWDGHGQGFALEASQLIIDYGFERLNLQRIELYVHEENSKAISLYERLGFKKEGILRNSFIRKDRTYNVHVMGLLKEEFKRQ